MGFSPTEQAILMAGDAVKEKNQTMPSGASNQASGLNVSSRGLESDIVTLEMEDGSCVFQDPADGSTRGRQTRTLRGSGDGSDCEVLSL